MTELLGFSIPTTITDDDGNTLASLAVAVTGPNGYDDTALTDAISGVLLLGPLPVGTYTITHGGRSVDVPVLPQWPGEGEVGQTLVLTAEGGFEFADAGPGGGGSAVSLDADGTLVVDGTTVELATDAQLLAEATARAAADDGLSAAIVIEATARDTAISTAVNALVNGAPGLLDTLGELAAQIGDDEDALAALTVLVNARIEKATFDANTILKADADDTPTALAVPASTVVGRAASGAITALTVAQVKTLLALSSADLSDVASLTTDAELAAAISGLSGTYVTVVAHGATAGTARTAGAVRVWWFGTVEPSNGTGSDIYVDTATGALYVLVSGTWTAVGGGGGLTTEQVQDIAGAMETDSSSIDFTYDDPAGTITAIIKAAAVVTAMLADDSVTPAKSAPLTITTQTGNYTAVLADSDTLVRMDVASANTFTVPPNSSVAFQTGRTLMVSQKGAGQVTLTPGAGVTLNSRGAALKTAGQYAQVSLIKTGTDEWLVAGDVTT